MARAGQGWPDAQGGVVGPPVPVLVVEQHAPRADVGAHGDAVGEGIFDEAQAAGRRQAGEMQAHAGQTREFNRPKDGDGFRRCRWKRRQAEARGDGAFNGYRLTCESRFEGGDEHWTRDAAGELERASQDFAVVAGSDVAKDMGAGVDGAVDVAGFEARATFCQRHEQLRAE